VNRAQDVAIFQEVGANSAPEDANIREQAAYSVESVATSLSVAAYAEKPVAYFREFETTSREVATSSLETVSAVREYETIGPCGEPPDAGIVAKSAQNVAGAAAENAAGESFATKKGHGMTSDLSESMTGVSVAAVLADLETQIEHHRTQRDLHAEQEALHGRQKEHHDAELAKISQSYEEFKRTAGAVLAMTSRRLPRQPEPDLGGGPPKLSKIVDALLAEKAGDEPFDAARIGAEIQQRFGPRLRRPVDPRVIAAKLRRMHAAGKLHQLREGRSHHGGLYCRERPGK
jgi:hypothetical protein